MKTTGGLLPIFATMLRRLQSRWNLSPLSLLLVLITFALGGSLCGYLGRVLLKPFATGLLWLDVILYVLAVTLIWPLCVLAVSIPLGQFRFFSNYLRRLFGRLRGSKAGRDKVEKPKTRLAIFASGGGSNALKIMEHFAGHELVEVAMVVCNKPGAGVLQHARKFGISTLLIERERFMRGDHYLPELEAAGIDFIVLAGFLWKMPGGIIESYPQAIINIHPALLPKYGGKGMYGKHVHQAVLEAGEEESGITIHYVDDEYDHGATIFQAMCPVEPDDTAETLAARVLQLEHRHYAQVVERVASSSNE